MLLTHPLSSRQGPLPSRRSMLNPRLTWYKHLCTAISPLPLWLPDYTGVSQYARPISQISGSNSQVIHTSYATSIMNIEATPFQPNTNNNPSLGRSSSPPRSLNQFINQQRTFLENKQRSLEKQRLLQEEKKRAQEQKNMEKTVQVNRGTHVFKRLYSPQPTSTANTTNQSVNQINNTSVMQDNSVIVALQSLTQSLTQIGSPTGVSKGEQLYQEYKSKLKTQASESATKPTLQKPEPILSPKSTDYLVDKLIKQYSKLVSEICIHKSKMGYVEYCEIMKKLGFSKSEDKNNNSGPITEHEVKERVKLYQAWNRLSNQKGQLDRLVLLAFVFAVNGIDFAPHRQIYLAIEKTICHTGSGQDVLSESSMRRAEFTNQELDQIRLNFQEFKVTRLQSTHIQNIKKPQEQLIPIPNSKQDIKTQQKREVLAKNSKLRLLEEGQRLNLLINNHNNNNNQQTRTIQQVGVSSTDLIQLSQKINEVKNNAKKQQLIKEELKECTFKPKTIMRGSIRRNLNNTSSKISNFDKNANKKESLLVKARSTSPLIKKNSGASPKNTPVGKLIERLKLKKQEEQETAQTPAPPIKADTVTTTRRDPALIPFVQMHQSHPQPAIPPFPNVQPAHVPNPYYPNVYSHPVLPVRYHIYGQNPIQYPSQQIIPPQNNVYLQVAARQEQPPLYESVMRSKQVQEFNQPIYIDTGADQSSPKGDNSEGQQEQEETQDQSVVFVSVKVDNQKMEKIELHRDSDCAATASQFIYRFGYVGLDEGLLPQLTRMLEQQKSILDSS